MSEAISEYQNLGPATAHSVQRQAVYFGDASTPLFGWLHTPANKPAGRIGMVLCPAIGIDYVNTYPVLRHLADRLASHGIPVLRFDYSGVGNSAGLDTAPGRVASWLRDIHAARATLMRIAGCMDAGLFGVRLGATLAAWVAHNMTVPCLVLWGPVTRGRAYVREMRAMYLTAEGVNIEGLADGGNIEAGGFVFTPETAQDLTLLDIQQLQPQAAQILFAARDDLTSDQMLPQAWSRAGVLTHHETLPGFSGMLVSPHNSQYRMPYAALDQLEQWIAATVHSADAFVHAVAKARVSPPELSSSIVIHDDPRALPVREITFRFGENNARFAIISEPLNGARPDTPWAIISNSGALHTAGPNRLYTLLSRALAQAGMRCVRFDFPGVGDSVAPHPWVENRCYQTSNTAEIATLITSLQREHGAQRFILMGLCSGAYASFHASLDLKPLPIVECLLFNPLTFYWEDGMSLDDPLPIANDAKERMEQLNLWQYYLGRMRDVRSWKNLLTAQSDSAHLIRTIVQRARTVTVESIQSRFGTLLPNTAVADSPLTLDIRRLIESGRRLTFVFARSDPGYGLLMTHAGPVVRRYLANRQVHIAFIERAAHTFTSQVSRNDFIKVVVNHLRERYRLVQP